MSDAAQDDAAPALPATPIHWLDRCYALLSGRARMFCAGLGDPELLALLDGPPLYRPLAALVSPAFDEPRRARGLLVRDGTFSSPVELLPEAARTVHLRWLTAPGPRRGAAVILPGSREAGYGLRASIYGSLVKKGIDLFLLEAPFYGARRPAGQDGENLATAAQQGLLVWAMAEEARGLLSWLFREGRGPVAVAGYSMGGFVAGAVGSLVHHAVGVAAFAAGVSPAATYTRMLLSRQVDWGAVGGPGGEAAARARLHRLFTQGSSARLPPPRTPQAAVIVACRQDGFVPAEETLALHARYPGARLRWLEAGHISGLFTGRAALRSAISESLERVRVLS